MRCLHLSQDINGQVQVGADLLSAAMDGLREVAQLQRQLEEVRTDPRHMTILSDVSTVSP